MSESPAGADERDIVTTFNWPRRPPWLRRAVTVDPEAMSWPGLIARVVRGSRRPGIRAVVLDASVGPRSLYRDLIAAVLIARRRRPPAVVLADCTWKAASRLDWLMGRAGVRLLDGPRVTYCVASTAEHRMFPQTWGVDASRVVITPWPFTLPDEEVDEGAPREGAIFAGGNSLRDWDTLIEAAALVPGEITLASGRLSPAQLAKAPPNVHAGELSHEEYTDRLRRSSVVVVPLRSGMRRSAGQTTYVNAMALGKLVVVSDAPAARDHIEHGVNGLVVAPEDPRELADALTWAVDPQNAEAVQRMCDAARRDALERFNPDRYVERMLEVVDASIARAG